jgi:hypothetical protein
VAEVRLMKMGAGEDVGGDVAIAPQTITSSFSPPPFSLQASSLPSSSPLSRSPPSSVSEIDALWDISESRVERKIFMQESGDHPSP